MVIAKHKKKVKVLVILLIFCFSLLLRLWNINGMGKTWDEGAQAVDGYHFIQLIKKGDFTNSHWYNHPDHPPLTKYLYGFAAQFDIENFNSPKKVFLPGEPTFTYDFFHARLVSILFSSLTVVLIVLFGWKYFSPFIGIVSGIILSLLPFFLGLSQLVTIESVLIFFFTASVYSFVNFLKNMSIKNTLLTGFLVGLALLTKYTNILLFPLFLWIYLLLRFYNFQKVKKGKTNTFIQKVHATIISGVFYTRDLLFGYRKVLYIFVISLITFIVFWPTPFFHLQEFISYNFHLRIETNKFSVPEVFFGKLMFVPKLYYVVHFLITTPFIILMLFFLGLKKISKDTKKNIELKDRIRIWLLYSVVIWFCLPFILSLYNFRQQGVRYIIEIYAPLSIIAALGFDWIVSKFTKSSVKKFIIFIPIILYLLIILVKISPYYLDYFNSVVGNTKGVYVNRLFQLGWWGQGVGEAGHFVKRVAPVNSRVGLAVAPVEAMPPAKDLYISEYNAGEEYDFVIVSYFNIVRLGFDDQEIRANYFPIYSVNADGASIVTVYQKIQ